MAKVFITRGILAGPLVQLKKRGHEYETYDANKKIAKRTLLESAKRADALIVSLDDSIDEEFLKLNQHLKIIVNYAVGFNNIDINAATKFGIPIANTPDVLTNATAELCVSLILSVARRHKAASQSIALGNWHSWGPQDFLGMELKDKCLGILGMGAIGQLTALKMQKAFGVHVIYHSSSKKELLPELKATFVSQEELIRESDILSLHCPLNKRSKGLFNNQNFKKMKKGAIFINTARGAIHDEGALLNSLNSGHLFGAGLDVTNPEPMHPNSKLLLHPDCLILPHIGSATFNAREAMSELAVKNILAAFEQRRILTPV